MPGQAEGGTAAPHPAPGARPMQSRKPRPAGEPPPLPGSPVRMAGPCPVERPEAAPAPDDTAAMTTPGADSGTYRR